MKSFSKEVPDKENGEDVEPINYFTYQFTKDNIKDLEGKMLTLVEATVEVTRQKATKDIVRDMFATKYNWLFESAHLVEVDTDYPHLIVPITNKVDGASPINNTGLLETYS